MHGRRRRSGGTLCLGVRARGAHHCLACAPHTRELAPSALPVGLQKTCDLHYNGFCNSVLWQLFHYVPLNIGAQHMAGTGSVPLAGCRQWRTTNGRCSAASCREQPSPVMQLWLPTPTPNLTPRPPPTPWLPTHLADSKLSETRMLQFQWGAHQLANKIFADVVLQHYQDGDIVWVQVGGSRRGQAPRAGLTQPGRAGVGAAPQPGTARVQWCRRDMGGRAAGGQLGAWLPFRRRCQHGLPAWAAPAAGLRRRAGPARDQDGVWSAAQRCNSALWLPLCSLAQDYHLMLLPAILKETKPRMKVGRAWPRRPGCEHAFVLAMGLRSTWGSLHAPCREPGAGWSTPLQWQRPSASGGCHMPWPPPLPALQVGFFLHTPFPSSEIYRTLPVREELLRSGEPGLLGLAAPGSTGPAGCPPRAAQALLPARALAAVSGQTAAACHSVRSACGAGGPAGRRHTRQPL